MAASFCPLLAPISISSCILLPLGVPLSVRDRFALELEGSAGPCKAAYDAQIRDELAGGNLPIAVQPLFATHGGEALQLRKGNVAVVFASSATVPAIVKSRGGLNNVLVPSLTVVDWLSIAGVCRSM